MNAPIAITETSCFASCDFNFVKPSVFNHDSTITSVTAFDYNYFCTLLTIARALTVVSALSKFSKRQQFLNFLLICTSLEYSVHLNLVGNIHLQKTDLNPITLFTLSLRMMLGLNLDANVFSLKLLQDVFYIQCREENDHGKSELLPCLNRNEPVRCLWLTLWFLFSLPLLQKYWRASWQRVNLH